jgi:putative tricarboxylic transport membrane protein
MEAGLKTQRRADIVVSCFITLLGLLVVLAAMKITGGAAQRLPPRTFPLVVGCLLSVCGLGLAIKSLRLRSEGLQIKWPEREGVWTIAVVLTSLALYIALMPPLGLPLSTFLYVSFSTWYLKRTKWKMAVLIGVVTGILMYAVFIRLLDLSFPIGWLFEAQG